MVTKSQQEKFIKDIAPIVRKYAPKYGISLSVCSAVIAQACLESAYGTSNKAKYHNYFGLKYRKNRLTVNKGYFEDGGSEQNKDGSYTPLSSDTAWYSFDSMESGVEGYFQFINIRNYIKLKNAKDPLEYLKEIRAAGYATSLKYVENVYNCIESNNLTIYDNDSNQTTNKPKPQNKIPNIKNNDNSKFIIGIDSGHGSDTCGKRSPDGYREHYSNTYIAYYLNKILQANGFTTVKVAWDDANVKDDPEVSLGERQNTIKKSNCTISVSIHANAFGDGKSYNSASGIITFYHSVYPEDSKKLAKCIQDQLIKGTLQRDRGIKSDNFALCNCKSMNTKASVLVEVAFMTNKEESELLKSDAFMRECAKEIAQGIFNYFGVSGRTNISIPTPSNYVGTTSINAVVRQNKPVTNNTTSANGNKFIYNGLDYSLVFDPVFYRDLYPDLKKVIGNDFEKLFMHFVTYGMKEQRIACETFNPVKYRERYADLRAAFGSNYQEYYKHYIVHGYKEKRKAK
jgi:N-acetylmuramoyl-L-alanine amidase